MKDRLTLENNGARPTKRYLTMSCKKIMRAILIDYKIFNVSVAPKPQ